QARESFGIARVPVGIWPAPSMSTSVTAQSASSPFVPHLPCQTMPQATLHHFPLASNTGNLPIGNPVFIQQPATPLGTYVSHQMSATTNTNFNPMPLQFNFFMGQHGLQAPIYKPGTQSSEVAKGGAALLGASETLPLPLGCADKVPPVHSSGGAPSAPEPATQISEMANSKAVLRPVDATKTVPLPKGHPGKVPPVHGSNSTPFAPSPVACMSQPNQQTAQKEKSTDPSRSPAKNALQAAFSKWTAASSSSTSKAAPGRPCQESGSVGKATELMCYTCECGFRCTSQNLLEQHMVKLHIIPFSNVCKLCGNRSSSLKAQKEHIVQHMTVTTIDDALNSKTPPQEKRSASGNPPREDSPLVSSTVHLDSDEDVEAGSQPPTSGENPDLAFLNLRQDLVGSRALKPFFKCVLGDCKFTTNELQPFVDHLTAHTVKELGTLMCIYCGQKCEAIAALLQHMVTAHGRRCYQCGWCLYRSTFLIHLRVHLHHFHPEKEARFFKCQNIVPESPSKRFASQCVTLTHYWCSVPGCGYKHLDPHAFEWHLTNEHPRTRQYQCKICDVMVGSAKDLVRHCVEHNMDVVQCVYCHHSEPSYEEMLWHLATYHQDHRLRLFIRTKEQRVTFRQFALKFQATKCQRLEPKAKQQLKTVQVAKSGQVAKNVQELTPASVEEPSKPDEAEMAFHCEQCSERLMDVAQLRSHLYTHKQYFPYVCKTCNTHFTTADKAQAHEQKGHKAAGNLHVQELRLQHFESQVDACVEKQAERLEAQVEDLNTAPCPWRGCTYTSADVERAACHIRALHLPSRQMCALCEFSSYSREVVRWHTKEVHKPQSPQRSIAPPVEKKAVAGDRKCGLCSFRAATSDAVREHWSKAHRGLAVRIVVPTRHSRASKAAAAKKRILSLPSRDPFSSSAASPPAEMSPTTEFWQEIRHGLPCSQCDHIAPSEHMLHMHRSLRHTSQPCATEVKKVAKLLKDFGESMSATRNTAHDRTLQSDDENSNYTKEVFSRMPTKREPKSDDEATEVDEDPEPMPPKRKRLEGNLSIHKRFQHEDEAQQQHLLSYNDKTQDQQPSSWKHDVQGKCPSPHKDYVCSCKDCDEAYATESELHTHMSDKHHFFAVCSYCKRPSMNKRQALTHLGKVHPDCEIRYTVIRRPQQRKRKEPSTSSTGLSVGMSWYRVPRETLNLDNVSVVTLMPNSTECVKLDIDVFFKLCNANPIVVVKDCLKFLA
ncbi:unnamed protein product, partial [Ixodes hexagonus]